MKRALIFDFGGVLMKTVDYSPRHSWDTRLGLTKGTVEHTVHNENSWRKAQTGQSDIQTYWHDISRRLKLSDEDVKQLAADFYAGDQLDMKLVDYIRKQRADGVTVALLSNDAHDLLRPKLERLEIINLFDPLVISSEIQVMKPDARAYEAILHRLGRPADDTIFIDDREENIEAAKALGIHGVHYVAGMNLPTVLEPLLKLG